MEKEKINKIFELKSELEQLKRIKIAKKDTIWHKWFCRKQIIEWRFESTREYKVPPRMASKIDALLDETIAEIEAELAAL